MVPKGWKRRFDEPIKLPGGGKLFTLKDAIAWLAKEIPQSLWGDLGVWDADFDPAHGADRRGAMRHHHCGL
jgi:hypothetical protein